MRLTFLPGRRSCDDPVATLKYNDNRQQDLILVPTFETILNQSLALEGDTQDGSG